MKVVIINATYGIGSTGGLVKDIQEALTKKGDICKIYCGETNAQKEGVTVIGTKVDHKIHGLLSRLTGLPGYFSYSATKKLLREIGDFNPDVVHLHNLHANYINLNELFSFLATNHIKTVVTLHDCFLFTGKCVHYTKSGCHKWQKECGNCPNLNSGNPIWFCDRTRKMLKDRKKWYSGITDLTVIGVSDWIINEAKRSVFKDKAIFQRIYNWIDSNCDGDIQGKNDIKKDGRKIIISVAAIWDDSKGLQDLIKLSEYLDDEFIIYIVGSCDIQMRRSNILCLGKIMEKEKLYRLYKSALVLFHPSLEETFGLIIAEALSVGTPAIVYNSTACPELIGDKCGYIEDPGDVEAVYNDIKEIAKLGKERYSDSCMSYAGKQFRKEERIDELLSVYRGGY